MNNESLKRKAVSGFFWSLFERFGAQGVTFVVSIILARLLDPSAYGVIAIVNVFSAILSVFVNKGLPSALVQKKNPDDLDFSSMFYFNIVLSIVLYALLFFFAPLIENFYNMNNLTTMIRVGSFEIIIAGIKSVECAYVEKNMMFKKFFFATLGGTIGAAVIGVLMAFNGFGVWALIAQSLFNTTVDTIILWFTVKWRPKWIFSFKRIKELFRYGWKILVSCLLDTGYSRARQLIIGKMYSEEDLAYYNRGQAYPSLLVDNVNSSINSVLFPSMSNYQDDKITLKSLMRRAIKLGTYIIMPIMAGFAVCSYDIIKIVLTDKWLPCVPFLCIFCFSYAFMPVHAANLNAIKALGRSDIFLKLEIIKKVVDLIAILSTMWFGVIYMAYSFLVTTILAQIINAFPNKKLLGYSYFEQLKDMLPIIMLSAGMGIIVYSVRLLKLNSWITLLIQIPLGITIYIIGSRLLKIDSFDYCISIIRSGFGRKNKKV